jgi:CheY-like chemotaxis protein
MFNKERDFMTSILIIDDSEADQFYNEMMFNEADADIRIVKAYDGEEALQILSDGFEPDLILLDINMPRMNGHAFLKNYYKDKSKNTPTVIMLTSSDQQKDKDQVKEYACVKDFFVKPLTDDLIKSLSEKFFSYTACASMHLPIINDIR